MRRTLLAFSIATMALTTTADHLIVVKVGGKSFAAKVEDTATGRAFMEKLPLASPCRRPHSTSTRSKPAT